MNLLKNICFSFFVICVFSTIALASNYNYESNANGIFEIQSIMLIDEMPAQFNGKGKHIW